jgi:hypothetical protein
MFFDSPIRRSVLGLGVLAALAAGAACAGEEKGPDVKVVKDKVGTYKFTDPGAKGTRLRAGEDLEFEFGWQGIAAASLRTTVEEATWQEKPVWKLGFEVRTRKAIDWAWMMSGNCRSLVDPKTLAPIVFARMVTENERAERRITTFDNEKSVARSVRARYRPTPRTKLYDIHYQSVRDPISVFHLLRQMPLEPGSSVCFEALFGSELYAFEAKVLKHEKIKVAAGTFDAARVKLGVHGLSSSEKKRKKIEKKYKDLTAWVTTDDRRLPVKLESAVFVGHVYGELKRYKLGEAPPEPKTAEAAPKKTAEATP